METHVDEVADGIYRLSTFVPEAGMAFNQYLLDADEPLLFHCGLRALFPLVSEAAARVRPVTDLRWITFGHVEADEAGAMNQWLAAAPNATVAHGAIGCLVSVNDLADRPPRPLQADERLDLGGKVVRYLATPHVPHAWDAGLLHDETTGTLLCGDLFTRMGDEPPVTEADPVGPALEAEDLFLATCLTPATGSTIRSLADLEPTTLALMHGPAYSGDGAAALRALGDAYDGRLAAA
jgi:flavorubredoxin